jgi:hypothetical protein
MDIGASLLYIPFLFTFIWSAIAVIIIIVKCILRRGRECRDLAIRSIRPLILISVYFTVQMAHNHSLNVARVFAAEKAILIQDYCTRTSLVPALIDDWPTSREYSGYQSEIYHGSPLASAYSIRYSTHEKTFTIDVRINIDESFTISGGVNEEITVGYGPYFEHHEKKIKKAEELIEFAKNPK